VNRSLVELATTSSIAWIATGLFTVLVLNVLDLDFTDTLFVAAVIVSVIVIGQGAFRLGGGAMSWVNPVSLAARQRLREKDDSPSGVLTPFAIALLVAAEVMVVTWLIGLSF
jgi:hypothetical protein